MNIKLDPQSTIVGRSESATNILPVRGRMVFPSSVAALRPLRSCGASPPTMESRGIRLAADGIKYNYIMPDKYTATWVSHSSISDFLRCPRLYYLRNVYKNPKTRRKINIIKPPLSLGQSIHEVIEGLSEIPVENRFDTPLIKRFDVAWEKVSGRKGGFTSKTEEKEYKARGKKMLKKVEKNPGPLKNKAVKIKQDLPHYWLSEDDNIILCGKIDWLEYVENDDSVRVLDFKTGKKEESKDSLQLPIYLLLASNTQKRKVSGVSYWYLDKASKPVEMKLPKEKDSYEKVLDVAKRIKLGRQIKHLKCPTDGCFACRDFERILKGEGEWVGLSEYKQDIYVLD